MRVQCASAQFTCDARIYVRPRTWVSAHELSQLIPNMRSCKIFLFNLFCPKIFNANLFTGS